MQQQNNMVYNSFHSPKFYKSPKKEEYVNLYFPDISARLKTTFIKNILFRLELGKVFKVNVIDKGDYKTAVVYIKEWSEDALCIKKQLIDGGEVSVAYSLSSPYFWKAVRLQPNVGAVEVVR